MVTGNQTDRVRYQVEWDGLYDRVEGVVGVIKVVKNRLNRYGGRKSDRRNYISRSFGRARTSRGEGGRCRRSVPCRYSERNKTFFYST